MRLNGVISNSHGVGARVEATVNGTMQVRVIQAGLSYLSDQEQAALFGFGAQDGVDQVTVLWPSGVRDVIGSVGSGDLEITEGDGIVNGVGFSGRTVNVDRQAEPGVTVTATHAGSGEELVTVSDENGDYGFENLLPGGYTLRARKSGFQQSATKSITVGFDDEKPRSFWQMLVQRWRTRLRLGPADGLPAAAASAPMASPTEGAARRNVRR